MTLLSCTETNYPTVAFRCSADVDGGGGCPAHYRCVSNACVAEGASISPRLSTSVSDDEAAFSVHSRGADVLICWNNSYASRSPTVYGAVMGSSSELVLPPTAIYAGDLGTAAVINGVTGSCAWDGSRAIIALTRLTGHDSFVTRLGSSDLSGGAPQFFADLPPYAENLPVNQLATHVDDRIWFPLLQFVQRGVNASQTSWGISIVSSSAGAAVGAYQRLPLRDLPNDYSFASAEFLGGSGGAWLALELRQGDVLLRWIDKATMEPRDGGLPMTSEYTFTPPGPIANYPIATNNDRLALAAQDPAGTWHVVWAERSASAAGDSGATFMQGPELPASSTVVRPGGTSDGANLLVATGDANGGVVVLSIPWGTSGAWQTVGHVAKLSSIGPRRLQIDRAGSALVVAWTELVPATNSGDVPYTALFAGAVVADQ